MYNSQYALAYNPFDKQQLPEKDCFRSKDFREMTARLDHLKDARGSGLFTASPGMGKTYALRCFAKNLNPNLYHMEYICLSTVSVAEFYKQLCFVLGVPAKGNKPGMFKTIQEQIWYLYHEKRQPLFLAIDEAAMRAVAGHAHGNPRLIDNIMNDAVTIGAQSNKTTIDTEVILAAVNNQNLG